MSSQNTPEQVSNNTTVNQAYDLIAQVFFNLDRITQEAIFVTLFSIQTGMELTSRQKKEAERIINEIFSIGN